MACSYPNIATFRELSELIESECRPWYLDGPNGVDWIFRNSITERREQDIYVDYVRDITTADRLRHWTAPLSPPCFFLQYRMPNSVKLIKKLFEIGAGSAEGLAVIADIWRSFEPKPETNRDRLRSLINRTLDRLAHRCGALDGPARQLILSNWPFPLWSLTMEVRRRTNGDLEALKKVRNHKIIWIEETEAKRDPPPEISRTKVEMMTGAYLAWQREVDAAVIGLLASLDGKRPPSVRGRTEVPGKRFIISYLATIASRGLPCRALLGGFDGIGKKTKGREIFWWLSYLDA